MAQDLGSLGATRMVVGLSQIVRFTPPANDYGFQLKNITTNQNGILEIVNPTFTGSSSMAGSSGGWGAGYPLAYGEIYSVAGPVSFYLAASNGVTATVAVIIGDTLGVTLL